MSISRSVTLLLAGAAFGAAAVLSCSDNSPQHTDAATCNCEPPIAGRLVTFESTVQTIQPGELSGAGTACDTGMQFISGGCTAEDPTVLQDIVVQQFGFDKTFFSWGCAFKNNARVPVRVKATVLCLKPGA
ncbi:MAG TPA: hypothetical protein VF516_30830 [Kofleriaceae bacterium]